MEIKDIVAIIKNGQTTEEFKETRIHGVDISNYQKNVDWTKVVKTQAFVILKATEGVNFVDPSAKKHGEGAESVGLPFGYYHFATPSPAANDATNEAKDFIKTLKTMPKWTLLPVLDLEQNKHNMTRPQMEAWVKEFNKVMFDELGRDPMMYGSPGLLNSYLPVNNTLGQTMPLWVAHYGARTPKIPNGWNKWDVWQYSDKNFPVDGIGLNVDVNHSTVRFLIENTIR